MPNQSQAPRNTPAAARTGASPGGVLKQLSPAAPGAKRHAARCGDALVCVRYRDDPARGRRLTTVESIVEERPLPAPARVRIGYGETELRARVKAAGGVWDAESKLWRLPKAAIRKLKLEDRVVTETAWIWISDHFHIRQGFAIFGQKMTNMAIYQ